MRIHLTFTILLSFAVAQVFAATTSDVCEDLKAVVCSKADRDDGTGINKRIENFEIKKLMDIDSLSKKSAEKLKAALMDPENSEFREIALAALPFERKMCPTADSLKTENCATSFSFEMAEMIDSENVGSSLVGHEAQRVAVNYQKNLRNVMRLVNTQTFQTVSVDAYSDLMKINKKPEQEKKIKEDLFPKVKEIMLKKIGALNIDAEAKERMAQQIQKVDFGGFECLKNPRTPMKYVSAQYLPEVSLNPTANDRFEIKLCRGISSFNESEFGLSFLLAHEIAHSFDPCKLTGSKKTDENKSTEKSLTELDNDYPLNQMISCLRSPKSVGALNKIDFCKSVEKKLSYSDNQCEFQKLKPVSHCNGTGFDKSDQIGEAVSDAFAAEVMVDFIEQRHKDLTPEQWRNGVSNILPEREECGKKRPLLFDEHPATMDRYNKLILAHPKIRKAMGCPEKSLQKQYCDPGFVKTPVEVSPQDLNGQGSGVQQ